MYEYSVVKPQVELASSPFSPESFQEGEGLGMRAIEKDGFTIQFTATLNSELNV